jgi:molybdate transport system substrate-binding protein
MKGRIALVLGSLLVAAFAVAGCGSDDDGGSSGSDSTPRLVVSAASSMTEALTTCSSDFDGADVKLSFAGSDDLAAQIRQGVKPDVFASANTKLPDALHSEGLLSKPVEFAANTLVGAVPEDSKLHSVDDFTHAGTTLAIGSESVPIGSYTREVLDRLPGTAGDAILENVRSNEPDVKGIVGKLTQSAVDGGFVYRSDVEATNGALRALPLPGEVQPAVVYAAGVVKGADQPALARRYVQGLVDGGCYRALQAAGFGPLK